MKVSVIGCGYLGLTHAAAMASLGHEVTGIEVDPHRLKLIQAGTVPYFEPGLTELIEDNLERLTFTDDYNKISDCQVHFVGVGTPQDPQSNQADLSQIYSAVSSLAQVINPEIGEVVIVGKSTVPPGTAACCKKKLMSVPNAELVWNPEFLREGHAVKDTLYPDRMVYGTFNGASTPGAALLDEAYAQILERDTPRIITDYPTSELIKMAANSFLATKISFANAWAHLCEEVGGDIKVLTKVIGMDARIGSAFLGAGSGFGGGCLPKDLHSTMNIFHSHHLKAESNFFDAVDDINETAHETVVKLIVKLLQKTAPTSIISGTSIEQTDRFRSEGIAPRVAILGASFKANSDDVRFSPALAIATSLLDRGIQVVINDPVALPNAHKVEPRAELSPSIEETIIGADLVVVGTEWPEFTTLNPKDLSIQPGMVVDARNCLDPGKWKNAGWEYYAVGRN